AIASPASMPVTSGNRYGWITDSAEIPANSPLDTIGKRNGVSLDEADPACGGCTRRAITITTGTESTTAARSHVRPRRSVLASSTRYMVPRDEREVEPFESTVLGGVRCRSERSGRPLGAQAPVVDL